MNRLQSLGARAREYLTPSVSALVSDLERKVLELQGAADALAAREERFFEEAAVLQRRAEVAHRESQRAQRIAMRVAELIS